MTTAKSEDEQDNTNPTITGFIEWLYAMEQFKQFPDKQVTRREVEELFEYLLSTHISKVLEAIGEDDIEGNSVWLRRDCFVRNKLRQSIRRKLEL